MGRRRGSGPNEAVTPGVSVTSMTLFVPSGPSQVMIAFASFESALPYDEFLARYGQGSDRSRWDASRANVTLTEDQSAILATFVRQLNVLVLAGAWCGDCAAQCPIFEKFAEAAPVLRIRYADRDATPGLAAELSINGGKRVPVAVFFSEDGEEISRFGEKTLTAYRKAGQAVTGGTLPAPGTVAGDWLREFERSQWVARLSPRLRRLHGD